MKESQAIYEVVKVLEGQIEERRAIIQSLKKLAGESVLDQLVEVVSAPQVTKKTSAQVVAPKAGKKRISAAARARIVAAQKKRWAKFKKEKAAVQAKGKAKAKAKVGSKVKAKARAKKKVAKKAALTPATTNTVSLAPLADESAA